MDGKTAEKKERLLAALGQGMVMVHLDARRPGVLVPAHLRPEYHLRLNLSYRFDPPDLAVNDWGVRSTLSFSGSRFTVAVPWSALFAVTSHATKEFWMFPDDMPPELLQQSALPQRPGAPAPEGEAAPVSPPPAPPRVALREVAREGEGEERSGAPAPEGVREEPPGGSSGSPPRRGHLRVVK